jgi:hypothetical protein
MFIYLKTVGLFIQTGTWRMSRPKNPGEMNKGLALMGNEVFGICDKNIEKLIVKCVCEEKYSLIYHLLNNFDDDRAWKWFEAEANGLSKI